MLSISKKDDNFSVSNQFVDKYMCDANGSFVKVYLYCLRYAHIEGSISIAKIASLLNMIQSDVISAFKYWDSVGVLKLYKNDKKRYTFSVHKLVAETFLEKPSYAECVNHKNGNKLDNRVENLEWCTYSYNNKEAFRLGLKKANYEKVIEEKKIKVVMFDGENIIAIKDCSRDMAIYIKEKYNIKSSIETIARSIRNVCKQNEIGFKNVLSTKRRKTVYGYKFSYLKDYS